MNAIDPVRARVELARRERDRKIRAELDSRARARAELLAFIQRVHPSYRAGWVHEEICRKLERFAERVYRGESPRLILTMPPRHGKTALVQRFTIWMMAKYQRIDGAPLEIACASYAQELADDNSRESRATARSSDAISVFPVIVPDVEKKKYLGDYRRADVDKVSIWKAGVASYKAVGVGGPLTGRGAHVLIIDDPIKDREQADSGAYRRRLWGWYTSTAYTRLAPGGGAIVIATRWHEDDLIGRLLRHQKDGTGDEWEVIDFPAIDEVSDTVADDGRVLRRKGDALHPDRYSLEALAQIKRAIGSREWAALYLCRPSPASGTLFRREYMRQRHDFTRENVKYLQWDHIVISADLTFDDGEESDFVAIHVWGRRGGNVYLLDRWHEQATYVVAKQAFRDLCTKWPEARAKLVEKAANGSALCSDLEGVVPGVIPVQVSGGPSKFSRARANTPYMEAGNVFYPNAPWIGDYVETHINFTGAPGGDDDDIDAESQALSYLFNEIEDMPTADDHARAATTMATFGGGAFGSMPW